MNNRSRDFLKKDETAVTASPKEISLVWKKYMDSGDEKAFTALSKSFDEEISFVLFKLRGIAEMTKDDNELRQCIRIAFMKVLRKYDVSKGATLKTYIRNTLYNRTIDELHSGKIIPKQNEIPALSLDEMKDGMPLLMDQIVDQRSLLEDRVLEEEMEDTVQEAITSLPVKQQTAISYYFFHGKTLARIGSIMGIQDDTVSQLVKRGILAIRAFLEKKGYSVQSDTSVRFRSYNRDVG